MRATIKKLRNVSGVTREELNIDRHILRFSNSQESLWKPKKYYAF